MPGRPALALAFALVGMACGGSDEAAPNSAAVATTTIPATTPAPSPATSSSSPTSMPAPTSTTEGVVHEPADVPVPADAVVPAGFPSSQATVTTAEGRICRLCIWIAEGDLRSRGLSSVDDIGAADGMAFIYPEPDTRTFNMEFVRFELDIAFFDADGRYMDAFSMEACPLGGCRRYQTPEDISVALEVRSGSLPALGIGPGSVLEITDLPCR